MRSGGLLEARARAPLRDDLLDLVTDLHAKGRRVELPGDALGRERHDDAVARPRRLGEEVSPLSRVHSIRRARAVALCDALCPVTQKGLAPKSDNKTMCSLENKQATLGRACLEAPWPRRP